MNQSKVDQQVDCRGRLRRGDSGLFQTYIYPNTFSRSGFYPGFISYQSFETLQLVLCERVLRLHSSCYNLEFLGLDKVLPGWQYFLQG